MQNMYMWALLSRLVPDDVVGKSTYEQGLMSHLSEVYLWHMWTLVVMHAELIKGFAIYQNIYFKKICNSQN